MKSNPHRETFGELAHTYIMVVSPDLPIAEVRSAGLQLFLFDLLPHADCETEEPRIAPGLLFTASCNGLVHAVHTAAAVLMTGARRFLLLRDLGDHGFGGEH